MYTYVDMWACVCVCGLYGRGHYGSARWWLGLRKLNSMVPVTRSQVRLLVLTEILRRLWQEIEYVRLQVWITNKLKQILRIFFCSRFRQSRSKSVFQLSATPGLEGWFPETFGRFPAPKLSNQKLSGHWPSRPGAADRRFIQVSVKSSSFYLWD